MIAANAFADDVIALATLISAIGALVLGLTNRQSLKTGNGKTIGKTVSDIKTTVNGTGDTNGDQQATP